MSKAVIAIDKSRSYRVFLAITTEMVEEARKIHGTTPLSTAAMGRVLTGAGLMGGMLLKNSQDKLTLQIKGDGPAAEILATAKGDGSVKGYIANPNLAASLVEGKFDVGGSVGIGTLTVIRDMGMREPYMGRINLVTGEIADDLTAYFFISEQQSSSVALGEKIDVDGSVLAAGGMIIQMLPNPKEGVIDTLEKMLYTMRPLSEQIEEIVRRNAGKTQEAILAYLLGDLFQELPADIQPEILEYREIGWNCDCSVERLEKVMISLGEQELRKILSEDGKAELVCQFCEKKYQFDKAHLEALIGGQIPPKKPKEQGGYLKDLLNNSDRF